MILNHLQKWLTPLIFLLSFCLKLLFVNFIFMMSDVRIDNYLIINDLTITQAFETRNVNHTATIFHYTSNRGKVN